MRLVIEAVAILVIELLRLMWLSGKRLFNWLLAFIGLIHRRV